MEEVIMSATSTKKVAVLFGGHSAEREVSLKSGAAVTAGLLRAGVDAHALDTAEYDVHQLGRDGFTHAFIALHGRGGEDGVMQGALEQLGIPYTGSRVLGAALAMDKIRTKQIWQSQGLPTALYRIVTPINFNTTIASDIIAELGSPVIIKPAKEGSSIGMAKVHNVAELEVAVTAAFAYDNEILVEQWIEGPEFTVAILGDEVLPVIQLKTPNTFYDYQAKYQSNTTEYLCPAPITDEQRQQLQAYALKAFHAVAAEGWGRVDAMLDAQGQFQLLEVNTVPGMTEKSLVPMAANAAGYNFDTLVSKVLALAH
ncbi:D-alanine--D-alanine ligase [Moritella sp.]|uniref:D-alanine--D-alanine ligase n=1 Tax=Moritella sp. TaxID=78556 RepID=UPI001DDB95B2|nr:D-alanine--D-alanine ligase [Moritella sp.]MCJ8349746.1 D-alanine--D-alanine ligase [Moritella sp.]NQZ39919.1 D-alanine--D-alanine ligase [Moritella sp.]